jgi:hypothetical protein
MRAAALARDAESRFGGAREVLVEHARFARADHVERAGHGKGRHRQARGQRLEQHQAEGVGAAGKDEDIGRGIEPGEILAFPSPEEMRPGVAAAQLVEHGTVAHHHLRARQVEVVR